MLADDEAEQRVARRAVSTPHLETLGVVELDHADYLERLAVALTVPLPTAFAD